MMCSYKSVSEANHGNLLSENWEENFWSNVLSPDPIVLNTSGFQTQFSDFENSQSVQVVCEKNDVAAFQDCQMQFAAPYQNVETSSLLSPAWEESAFEIPQSSINMSTYFSTFNPSYQLEDTPMHQTPVQPVLNAKAQNTGTKTMHDARISLVPIGNGNFKAIVKRKRKRTVFTTEQLEVLEQVFSKKPYVSRDERQLLVERLQVNDKSVKIWFQNRRLKNKRGDEMYEGIQDDNIDKNNCTIYDRLDTVESKIIERTDEFGFVTLDDKIMNDLVNIIDDYLTSNISPGEAKTEIDSSPIYEPISPASTSEYSCEENATNWQHYEPKDSIQELIDIESIIST